MEEAKTQSRVRLNFSQNSKGHVQVDGTVEFPSVEECGENMRKLLDEAKTIIREKCLVKAGSAG